MELSDEVHLEAEFALALAPLFDPIVEDHSHYAACRRLNDYEPVLLHADPSDELVVVLNEDLAFEEVSVEALALGKDLQDFPSCFYLIQMPDLIVIFEDVFLIVGPFCTRGQCPELPLGD